MDSTGQLCSSTLMFIWDILLSCSKFLFTLSFETPELILTTGSSQEYLPSNNRPTINLMAGSFASSAAGMVSSQSRVYHSPLICRLHICGFCERWTVGICTRTWPNDHTEVIQTVLFPSPIAGISNVFTPLEEANESSITTFITPPSISLTSSSQSTNPSSIPSHLRWNHILSSPTNNPKTNCHVAFRFVSPTAKINDICPALSSHQTSNNGSNPKDHVRHPHRAGRRRRCAQMEDRPTRP